MDKATSGKILVDGKDVAKYGEKELTQYRRDDIGFVFQFYNLVQNLTALENVELATQISKNPLDVKMVLNRVILPLVALSIPPNKFKIVVFPAPDGPTITTNSPLSILKSTPSEALISISPILYVFFTLSKTMKSFISVTTFL